MDIPGSDSGGNVWADLVSFPRTQKLNKRHDYTLTWLMLFSFSEHITAGTYNIYDLQSSDPLLVQLSMQGSQAGP